MYTSEGGLLLRFLCLLTTTKLLRFVFTHLINIGGHFCNFSTGVECSPLYTKDPFCRLKSITTHLTKSCYKVPTKRMRMADYSASAIKGFCSFWKRTLGYWMRLDSSFQLAHFLFRSRYLSRGVVCF